jgi:hypothetical protein
MSNTINNSLIAPHVWTLIDQFVPDHVRENNPRLIQFIEAYLRFLEESSRAGYFLNTLEAQRNLETQQEEFIHRIEKEIGLFVPREYAASPRLFYNKISELWRAKGSEDGIKAFFRLFNGEDAVEIRYPWERVLKTSDGRWIYTEKLRVSMISGDPLEFIGQQILQIESYGIATITDVERQVYADGIIYALSLAKESTSGDFIPGHRVFVPGIEGLEAEIYKSLQRVEIVSPGVGYSIGDRVRLGGRDRITFEARVVEVDEDGRILDLDIVDFGSGNTPLHIRNAEASGPYYFVDFDAFTYADDDIGGLFNEQVNIEENIDLFYQNYNVLTDSYFWEVFAGTQYSTSSEISEDNSFINKKFVDTSSVGSGGEFKLHFGGIVVPAGYYSGVYGQLSESIVLQDSEFYQKFSYEIITPTSITDWINPLRNLMNPAGFKPFGLTLNNEYIDSEVIINSHVHQIDI